MRFSALLGLAILGGAVALSSCKASEDEPDDVTGGSAGRGGSDGGSGGRAGSGGKGGKGGSGGTAGSGGSSGSLNDGGEAGVGEAGEAGEAGETSGGSSGATGSAGEAGQAGAPAAGGSAGETASAGAGGEAGGEGLLQAADCREFPATIEMSEIESDTYGAVFCVAGITCRITSNTLFSGVNPCPGTDRLVAFNTVDGSNAISIDVDWEIISTTAGTIDASDINDIPIGSSITAVIEEPSSTQYELVFEFEGGRGLTVTSFVPLI